MGTSLRYNSSLAVFQNEDLDNDRGDTAHRSLVGELQLLHDRPMVRQWDRSQEVPGLKLISRSSLPNFTFLLSCFGQQPFMSILRV